MRRRRRSGFGGLIIISVILTGICFVLLMAAFILVPYMAESRYGKADAELSTSQRFTYSAQLLLHSSDLEAKSPEDQAEILVTIKPGQSVQKIVEILGRNGLLKSSAAFTNFLIYKGLDRSLQSGQFYLSRAMSAPEIAQRITSSTGDRTQFATLAGWRSEEVATSIQSYGFQFSSTDFQNLIDHPENVSDLPEPYRSFPSLEGFLFPGQYPIDREITASDLIDEMVTRFDENLTPKMVKGFKKQGLSLYQGVILASIIEKEAVLDQEKATIASVFYNRLAAGMNLETDPTVQYAVGFDPESKSWWKNPLTANDLQTNSPYNTYQNSGLPPTPICSPGVESLKAASIPATTNYYYFRSACSQDGSHVFSNTYQEHLANACP